MCYIRCQEQEDVDPHAYVAFLTQRGEGRMASNQVQNVTGEGRREMGREIQRIGLGFLTTPKQPRGPRWSPKQWLGIRLERIGRRLQHRNTPVGTLATARSETR
jgi:hypothetical protein